MNCNILMFCFILQVQIVLEGADEYSNLIGSVYYQEGEQDKDLAGLLVETVCYIYHNLCFCLIYDILLL